MAMKSAIAVVATSVAILAATRSPAHCGHMHNVPRINRVAIAANFDAPALFVDPRSRPATSPRHAMVYMVTVPPMAILLTVFNAASMESVGKATAQTLISSAKRIGARVSSCNKEQFKSYLFADAAAAEEACYDHNEKGE